VKSLSQRLLCRTRPGFDPQSGFYYAGPQIEPVAGTKHLDALLRDFCWKKPADRTNYLGILLTGLLVSRFIGSKPAALFNGNQPELGKSVLAQILAILRDGQHVETASYNPNDEEFENRIGTIVRRGVTTIIIDNAKARGRNAKIDSACLERSITDPILSYRLLGFSQEIRSENSHLFCITANSPDVSRDLITRCVVINLHYEGDPTKRSFSMDDPEAYVQTHRLELLGELADQGNQSGQGGRIAVPFDRYVQSAARVDLRVVLVDLVDRVLDLFEAFVSLELGAYEFASLAVGCFWFDTRVAFCSPSGREPRYLVSVVVWSDRCGVAVWQGGLEFDSEGDLVSVHLRLVPPSWARSPRSADAQKRL